MTALRWCLYTPRRAATIAVCALVLLVAVGRTVGPGGHAATRPRPSTAATASARPGVAPVSTAVRFVGIWTDHTLGRAAWWRMLQPMLTPDMAQRTAAVDPAEIPATIVTGPGVIVTDTPLTVRVPTDAGGVLVHLDPTGRAVTAVTFETVGN